jgi:hypothetical protein
VIEESTRVVEVSIRGGHTIGWRWVERSESRCTPLV